LAAIRHAWSQRRWSSRSSPRSCRTTSSSGARYEDLSAKHQNALVNEDIARKEGGERFVVLNPAPLPSRPDSPDLLKLMLMSLGIGFGLGTAAVVGREFLDRSVHDARVLQSEFEVPVLGEIPEDSCDLSAGWVHGFAGSEDGPRTRN
jgi:hypothetical protein